MGTYRQPSQLIDKSFEKLNQGFAQVGQQMQAQLAAKQKAKLQAAQDAAKKRDREYASFDKKRDKAVMDYQVKIDNWEHINQEKGEDWEAEDVTIENQLKDNANHYLDIMGEAQEDSTEYRTAERSLRNMIEQYPIMAGLLNQESEEVSSAYNPTGEDRLADDKAGALLLSNDPMAGTKTHMLHDIKFSRHPERFKVTTGPTGVTMTYQDPDTLDKDGNPTEFTLNAAEYKMYKEGGNDLIGVTNEDDFNKFMDGVWDIAGNDYKPFKEKLMQYRKDKASGQDVKITEVTKTYERANATLKANIEKYVKGNGTITQSQWQLMGGKGVYDPANEEMQKQAVDLLYNKQLDKYGKDAENNFTAQELKQKKIEKDEKIETLKTGGFEIKNVPGLTGGTHSYIEVKDAYANAPDKTSYTVALLNNAMNQDGLNGNYVTGAELIQSAIKQGVKGDDLKELEANIASQGGANAIFQPGSEKEGYIKQDINAWTDVRGRLGKLKGFDKDAMMQLDGNVEATDDTTPFKIIDLSKRQGGGVIDDNQNNNIPATQPPEEVTEKAEEKVQDADVDEVFGVEEDEIETEPIKNFYDSNTDIEKPIYKNDKGENVSFEDDSELFLSEQEVAHGGNDNSGKATSLKEYAPGGSSYKFIKEHLESKDPVGKGTYFDGTVKKGLKTDIGEDIYNGLSDPQKAILRMEHLNVGWNPKVLMLYTAGLLPKTDGEDATITGGAKWHSKAKSKEILDLYEKNKKKISGLLKGKDAELLAGLDAIYKATDNSKNNFSEKENALRKKGFEEQYSNRIRDIKARYKI
jgi:hypothetical protein